MRSNILAPTFALAVLVALQSTAFSADPKIGSATATKNKVEGVVEGKSQDLNSGSEIFTNEIVRTSAGSVADLQFLDKTTLVVGPISEIRLDKFVYDPSGSTGTIAIQASKGAFRFITGSQDKKTYEIKTPYGTLGVRS